MEIEKLIEALRTKSRYEDKATLEIMDLCMMAADRMEELNDFEQTQCANLLVELAEKEKQLHRVENCHIWEPDADNHIESMSPKLEVLVPACVLQVMAGQLAAAVEDLEKHCRKCTHQLDNEVGCDCEGLCDPTKWRVAQKNSFTPQVPPEWVAQIERRFMAGEGGG